jgi:hypothetical protein
MYLQHNTGLADNGDYARSMAWISSGPIGIGPNWPIAGSTERWPKRFLDYWIPFWKLEWNISASTIPATSAIVLWFPGVVINHFFYSPKILYLPLLSLFPNLLLLGVLLLLFKWISIQTRHRFFLLLGVGVPMTFLFTSTDYIVYFNTFYQETASFVFLFLFLSSILILKRRPSLGYLVLSIAFLLFLATSKTSNVYWPFIAVPFVFHIWSAGKKIKLRTKFVAGLALIVTFTFVSQRITARGSVHNPPYDSLFDGVLTFSENPSEHLHRLGFDGAMQCVNTTSFSVIGNTFFTKYKERMTYQSTLDVIYHEPMVLFNCFKYALDNMQKTNLTYLGKYAFDDPRNAEKNSVESLLNLWGLLKLKFFPVGYSLAFVLVGFLCWFIIGLKQTGLYHDLSIIGLLCSIACIIDMFVAILGDGKLELPKHLFLSNVLFDIAIIVFLSNVLLFCLELAGRKLSKSDSHKSSKL